MHAAAPPNSTAPGARTEAFAGGAKAVLAMQADVSGNLAGDFAAALYKSLATGTSLEDAMNQARAVIPGVPRDIGWALPAMTVRERNARLFAPQPLPADELRKVR